MGVVVGCAGCAVALCVVRCAFVCCASLHLLAVGCGFTKRVSARPVTRPSPETSEKVCLGCLVWFGSFFFFFWLVSCTTSQTQNFRPNGADARTCVCVCVCVPSSPAHQVHTHLRLEGTVGLCWQVAGCWSYGIIGQCHSARGPESKKYHGSISVSVCVSFFFFRSCFPASNPASGDGVNNIIVVIVIHKFAQGIGYRVLRPRYCVHPSTAVHTRTKGVGGCRRCCTTASCIAGCSAGCSSCVTGYNTRGETARLLLA